MAAAHAANKAIWLKRLLSELDPESTDSSVTVYCGNQGTIALAENPSHHSRSKHIDITVSLCARSDPKQQNQIAISAHRADAGRRTYEATGSR
jgi:hypothetical protein